MTTIHDANTNQTATVFSDGALKVSATIAASTVTIPNKTLFSAFLGASGFSVLTDALNVNGSISIKQFYGEASTQYSVAVKRVVLVLLAPTNSPDQFGGLAALVRGVQLYFIDGDTTTYLLSGAKTYGQILLQSGVVGSYYTSGANFDSTNSVAIYTFDLATIFGTPFNLAKNSQTAVVLEVRDNLTSLAGGWAQVFGVAEL